MWYNVGMSSLFLQAFKPLSAINHRQAYQPVFQIRKTWQKQQIRTGVKMKS